jgi:hypothetical protein
VGGQDVQFRLGAQQPPSHARHCLGTSSATVSPARLQAAAPGRNPRTRPPTLRASTISSVFWISWGRCAARSGLSSWMTTNTSINSNTSICAAGACAAIFRRPAACMPMHACRMHLRLPAGACRAQPIGLSPPWQACFLDSPSQHSTLLAGQRWPPWLCYSCLTFVLLSMSAAANTFLRSSTAMSSPMRGACRVPGRAEGWQRRKPAGVGRCRNLGRPAALLNYAGAEIPYGWQK